MLELAQFVEELHVHLILLLWDPEAELLAKSGSVARRAKVLQLVLGPELLLNALGERLVCVVVANHSDLNLNNINLALDVNGNRRQTGNTERMIFNFNFLISHLSQFMTLYPGTIITTGTPAGTAMEMEKPEFLKAGDKLHLKVDGLGEQFHEIIDE